MMLDSQIEYLQFLLTQTKVEVFWRRDGDLIPIRSVKSYALVGKDDEPKAFLDGSMLGKHIDLWNITTDELRVIPDIAKWPQNEET